MPNFDFPENSRWLNTDLPLRLAHELKGHIVLLHFWSYTCIHCLQMLTDLEHLRSKFAADPFIIIGIHAGKYGDDPPAIRAAIERHNIAHPVFIDSHRAIWNHFAINTWPTAVLLGADGVTLGAIAGEGHHKLLDHSIARSLALAKSAGTLAPTPFRPQRAPTTPQNSPLLFPNKILADPQRQRLIILDTNHHRILLTTWPDAHANVTVQQIIGTGTPALHDGPLAEAAFNSPQGAVLSAGRNAASILWIADTGNHCIRRIDLSENRVTTVLGTGHREFDNEAGKSGRDQPLNSPRDVALFANRLYISQAGQHQIFAMNLLTSTTEIAAGTARESLRDGEAPRAYLAQPSGLALDPQNQILYFTDAENSAVRALDLRKKQVRTLIGKGLFNFGDTDGNFDNAQLQHPMGLALTANNTQLLLADTLNHKIKILDLPSRTAQTLPLNTVPRKWSAESLNTGCHGPVLRPVPHGTANSEANDRGSVLSGANLFEPTAVTPADPTTGEILIADTNNHRIVHCNLTTGACRDLIIHGLPAT